MCVAHLLCDLRFIIDEQEQGWATRMRLETILHHETGILSFTRNPHCPFSNFRSERHITDGKVKQKVSGTFRAAEFADAYYRMASYLQSMSMLNYNPIPTIENRICFDMEWIFRLWDNYPRLLADDRGQRTTTL